MLAVDLRDEVERIGFRPRSYSTLAGQAASVPVGGWELDPVAAEVIVHARMMPLRLLARAGLSVERTHVGICDHRSVEDVVAVELITPTGGPHFVVTFGRIQNRVDPAELEAIVLSHAGKFGLGHATAARVCGSLQEAREAPYFFEALIDFGAAMAGVRALDNPDEWRDGIDAEMRSGGRLYYLGDPQAEWFRRD